MNIEQGGRLPEWKNSIKLAAYTKQNMIKLCKVNGENVGKVVKRKLNIPWKTYISTVRLYNTTEMTSDAIMVRSATIALKTLSAEMFVQFTKWQKLSLYFT